MEVDHYEHLPAAGVLLPKTLRAPVAVIYHIARTAGEIVDEGDFSAQERRAGLADLRAGLEAVANDQAAPVHPMLFAKLARVVCTHGLPLGPLQDLLSAFEQDIDTTRYADWPGVLDYCRRSANPFGRLMLHLFDAATPDNLADSDKICTALQLIHFLQDAGAAAARGRIYLPLSDLDRFGVTAQHMERQICDDAFRALMQYEVSRAHDLLGGGAALALRLPGRAGLALCGVVHAGLRALEKVEHADYDVLRERPVLAGPDWVVIVVRSLAMWLRGRVGVQWRSVEN